MGNKDPTPNADRLRVQREERYGHLQATAVDRPIPIKPQATARVVDAPPKPARKRKKLKRKTS